MERRELFGSLFSSFRGEKKEKKEVIVRPPYFYYENSTYKDDVSFFTKECVNCEGVCSTFCEEKIIVITEDKTPKIDFSLGGCTYCDACAKACPSGVLKVEYKHQIRTNVEINMLGCMSWDKTMCFSCKDPCLEDAIEFLGMFRPTINREKCTNCGFCIAVCPTGAISINEIKEG